MPHASYSVPLFPSLQFSLTKKKATRFSPLSAAETTGSPALAASHAAVYGAGCGPSGSLRPSQRNSCGECCKAGHGRLGPCGASPLAPPTVSLPPSRGLATGDLNASGGSHRVHLFMLLRAFLLPILLLGGLQFRLDPKTCAQENEPLFMQTSAKTAVDVNDVFHEIAKRLLQGQHPQPPLAGMVLSPAERMVSSSSCCSS